MLNKSEEQDAKENGKERDLDELLEMQQGQQGLNVLSSASRCGSERLDRLRSTLDRLKGSKKCPK